MTASMLITLAGLSVCVWAFARLTETQKRGEWLSKLTLLALFATCSTWVVDRLFGDAWRWDGALFLAAIAAHLWLAAPPRRLAQLLRRRRSTTAAPPPI